MIRHSLAQQLYRASRASFTSMVLPSILSTIGDTPIVRVNNLLPQTSSNINLYTKLEFFNPLSSVKDRLAIAVIEAAERDGTLKPGQTVVEATSGNTGIALAMVCAQKKYPLIITMSEAFSVERRKIMRFLGAKVILTPAAKKGTGMVLKAQELATKHGYFYPSQFTNKANTLYHAKTTASEILSTFTKSQKVLDYLVTGWGTGGTVTGVSSVFRVASPETKIILSEPENAALVSSGKPQKENETHEKFTPHPIQGWTPDFIPEIIQRSLNSKQKLYDEIITVTGPEAISASRSLAKHEGIFCGISSGGTLSAALKLINSLSSKNSSEKAKNSQKEINVLAILPDTGERYLSTPLFESIGADMNESEIEISKSTSGFQL